MQQQYQVVQQCLLDGGHHFKPPLDHLALGLSDLPHKQSVWGSTAGFVEFGFRIGVGLSRYGFVPD